MVSLSSRICIDCSRPRNKAANARTAIRGKDSPVFQTLSVRRDATCAEPQPLGSGGSNRSLTVAARRAVAIDLEREPERC